MSEEKKIDDGGAAFPKPPSQYGHGSQDGMTLRDYFAAAAPAQEVQGIIGDTVLSVSEFLEIKEGGYDYKKHYMPSLAKARYAWADAMIAARKDVK